MTPRSRFMEVGFDSVVGVQLARWLERQLQTPLDATLFFHHPTPGAVARYLAANYPVACAMAWGLATRKNDSVTEAPIEAPSDELPLAFSRTLLTSPTKAPAEPTLEPIAVIGLACRFPGASTVDQFWANLCQGLDSVGEMPLDRQALLGLAPRDAKTARPMGGYLRDIGAFDPGLFQLSEREARLIDPQQRVFLEVAWEALETAGYPPEQLQSRRTGVFVGVSTQDYVRLAAVAEDQRDPHLRAGNALSMIANRVSYLLDLRGPSLSVDTACSSALVAIHLACQALRAGEAHVALAGGVHLNLNAEGDDILAREGLVARDGRAKPFDDRADGFARGEGAAALVLKPLSAALRDRDAIWAVLRGSAVNNDGHDKAGLAAPSPRAQAEAIAAAWELARVAPDSIGYIEAHGTGTALGDPIEVQALTSVFGARTPKRAFCGLGSVKSNLGHLEAAAGAAGLLKAVLAVAHGCVPPTLHFESPNRALRFEQTPFFVNDRLRLWQAPGPRRAGVSSFGFGGTNVHVVVEQPPQEASTVAPAPTETSRDNGHPKSPSSA